MTNEYTVFVAYEIDYYSTQEILMNHDIDYISFKHSRYTNTS